MYIGAGAAVGAIGLVQAVLSVRAARRQGRAPSHCGIYRLAGATFPLWIAIVGYALSTLGHDLALRIAAGRRRNFRWSFCYSSASW